MNRGLVLLFILIPIYLFSGTELDLYIVKEFNEGKDYGEIRWNQGFYNHAGISTADIGCDDQWVYISDFYNNRLLILDYNFKIIKYLDANEGQDIPVSFDISSFMKKYILFSTDGYNPVIFSVDTNERVNFVTVTDFILDSINLNIDRKFVSEVNNVKVLDYLDVLPLEKYSQNQRIFNTSINFTGYLNEVNNFLTSEKQIIYNNRLLTHKFEIVRKFFELNTKYNKNVKDRIKLKSSFIEIIGFDRMNRSYWIAGGVSRQDQLLVICSEMGEVLHIIKNNTSRSIYGRVCIMSNGDILSMTSSPKNGKFYLYKIPNTWDPVLKDGITKISSPNISATSYIDYESKYVGACAFDNNPMTAWLEGRSDEGLGEKITIEFENSITVDKIEFMPGYFDPKWFSANNRVKRLRINLDGEMFYTNFDDIMKPQFVTFKEAKSFKKAEFTIVSVYPGKDNDTAISEIAFYLNGEKLKLE